MCFPLQVPMEERPAVADAPPLFGRMREAAAQDRNVFEKGKLAFVSYIRCGAWTRAVACLLVCVDVCGCAFVCASVCGARARACVCVCWVTCNPNLLSFWSVSWLIQMHHKVIS